MAQDPVSPPAELTAAELTLDDVRARVRAELVILGACPTLGDELEIHDLAALADTYTRLGGDLELTPAPSPARFNPADVKLRETVRAAAWHAADAASVGTAAADLIASNVAEALEELAQ